MLLDTEPEATGIGEVFALELVFLHLEPSLEDLQRLVAADLHHSVNHNTTNQRSYLIVYSQRIGVGSRRGSRKYKQAVRVRSGGKTNPPLHQLMNDTPLKQDALHAELKFLLNERSFV